MTPQFKAAVETYGPRFMADLDLERFHVGGMFGNFAVETDEFIALQEYSPATGSRGGWGWPQWTGIRRDQFEAWAKQQGYALDAPEAFYGFVLRELGTTEKAALAALRRTRSVDAATESFMLRYERPGVPHLDRRKRCAREALALLESTTGDAPAPIPPASPRAAVDPAWMPQASMQRIIVHWTAGAHKASALDREHYHILIEGDGALVRGTPSIRDNQAPTRPGYAAHTLNCNGGSIGVSLCCMAGAVERPFSSGSAPMTRVQWDRLPGVLADLCARYGIAVTPETVLSHAEVQSTLGIKQRGKWDIARLSFDPSVVGAGACGELFRTRAREAMAASPARKPIAPAQAARTPAPMIAPVPLPDGAPTPVVPVPQVTTLGYLWSRIRGKPILPPATLPPAAQDEDETPLMRDQRRLIALGYTEVRNADGDYGTRTRAGIMAFQADNGLPVTGAYDEALASAIATAKPRIISVGQATATKHDLRAQVPEVAKSLDGMGLLGKLILGASGVGAVDASGALDTIKGAADQATQTMQSVQTVANSVVGAVQWIIAHWWIIGIVAGLYLVARVGMAGLRLVVLLRQGRLL